MTTKYIAALPKPDQNRVPPPTKPRRPKYGAVAGAIDAAQRMKKVRETAFGAYGRRRG